ncbi:glycosyltransferase involved in cell wall biosynthesis [Desulfobotulus alkaliphilus]|uniref:Glycosyltransferase involved in cell wall biosynthesis n=1 Tax=Desulfobotulus alkaliphilus TaxID=622671 RepID=A0A562RIL2_9BACT|nr:glycosyltransferase [Desulfobotulus alkaliphilus]TWI68917.1 glycosyltransferase involved in cell wall biosynthesis [Desulfobotulus alkaliphilus]
MKGGENKTILWWGRFDASYSRNRILRKILQNNGYKIIDFIPRISRLGGLEAFFRVLPEVDMVWVPCFRQTDVVSARRWSAKRGIPLLFDPLISDYDKQVFERRKYDAHSIVAKYLRMRESTYIQCADILLADTPEHASFFVDVLGADRKNTFVVIVGAEEELFFPDRSARGLKTEQDLNQERPLDVLFYGSFIPLQGPQYIAEAIHLYEGPPVSWHFLGDGPLLEQCKARVKEKDNVFFEKWTPYDSLPERIHRADILLGIFGDTPKTQRVIPNKVYQAIASGKPVITAKTPAYPSSLTADDGNGFIWVPAASPEHIARAVACLAKNSEKIRLAGQAARVSFDHHFSYKVIDKQLYEAMEHLS